MPLVRLIGSDAESFDTFDVAEMTDHRNHQHSHRNTWSSRQSGNGVTAAAAAKSRYTTSSTLSPTPEADDLTSIDSSSGRRSEDTDRVGSVAPRGMMSGRGQSSSTSVTSMNSFSVNANDNIPHNSQWPLYETIDNLDEMEHDPRNPFNRSQNSAQNNNTLRSSWGDHNIPEEEEDETGSLSSYAEDSSVTPSLHQFNSQQMNQHQSRHQRNRYRQSENDDSSIASYQSHRQDSKRTSTSDNSSHVIIQQLESQVAKLNFELATTKSSLDELQLENRRLNDDKDKLTNNTTLLQEENERLYLTIERLQKEQIIRHMQGTKGVARASNSDQDSCVVWGGATASGNTWFGDGGENQVKVKTQQLGKVEGDSLEVPFRSEGREYHLRPRRRSSICSTNSFNSMNDDTESRASNDCLSAHSVALNESHHSGDLEYQLSDTDEQDKTEKSGTSLLEMIEDSRRRLGGGELLGGGEIPSARETAKRMKEAAISLASRDNGQAEKGEAETGTHSLPVQQELQHNLGVDEADAQEGDSDDDDYDDYDDDDPFATWSAREPTRKQNWLQKGLGGIRRDSTNSTLHELPQANDIIEDPFDSCNGNERNNVDYPEKYTSFADDRSELGDSSSVAQGERKRFGWLRRGRRNSSQSTTES